MRQGLCFALWYMYINDVLCIKKCNQKKNALVTIPDWRLQLAGAAQACFQNLTRLGH